MTVPIPDEMSQRKRIALIAAGSIVAVVIVAVGAWATMRPRTTNSAPRAFTPAEETSASGPATSSAVASALAGEGTSGSAQPAGAQAGSSKAVAKHPKIAFRLGRSLYVANEDGTGAVPLKVAESEYALSPDGTSIAVVRGGKLVIMSVATGESLTLGAAERVVPVWTPDSSAVLFVRAGVDGVPSVWRVRRDGTAPSLIGPGQGVAVSPDGATLVMLPTEADADTPQITVRSSGKPPVKVPVSGGTPIAATVSNDRLYVSTLSAEGVTAIWSSEFDGSGRRELVGSVPADGKTATYGQLLLSPDGKSLAYTADGDDGYSRIWVVPTTGGSPRQITARRDGYPLGWTVDGSAIVFFEGNSFQGESSALWRSDSDGMNRRMMVSGASR